MRIYSTAFAEGGENPAKNTQEAEDLSPELVFEDIPAGTKSLVLIADDPDAPDPKAPTPPRPPRPAPPPPADTRGLPEGVKQLPAKARAGINDCDVEAWSGPRPPIGVHRYYFHLFALDTELTLSAGFKRADVEKAMKGHILAKAQTFGTSLLLANR